MIEGAFGLAIGMMLAAAGWRAFVLRREGPPVLRGRVNPPGLYGFDLVGVLILAGVYFGFHWLGLQPPPEDAPESLSAGTLLVAIASQLMILGMVLATMLPRCGLDEFLGLRWRNWPWVLLIAPFAVAGVWVLIGMLEAAGYSKWMAEWFGGPELQESVTLLRESGDPLILGLMAVAAVLVAPICEECVFRGYVYPVMKRFGGAGVGALGSALLFAAAHNHVQTLFPLFLLGLVLVWVYELTGSIWAPVAVHLLFNALTVGITLLVRILGLSMEVPG